jgi:hypothetical protein
LGLRVAARGGPAGPGRARNTAKGERDSILETLDGLTSEEEEGEDDEPDPGDQP